jgi:Mn-containing catalase
MKKKRKVFNKLELFETSVVGTPAYPDAHFNSQTSFMKALKEAYDEEIDDQLNEKKEVKQMEEQKLEIKETPVAEVKTTEQVEVAKETEVKAAEVVTETKEVKSEIDIKSIVEATVKEALDKLTVERGLVETQKAEKMSVGELFIKSGLFQKR